MDVLREVNWLSIVTRIILAVLIGGMLGIERERKNRPAGFRTHILVCLGSMLVMLTNQYAFQLYGGSDPVRMGAQVVSGIGFLGAGTIIVTGRNEVKGITTAAGLWTAACCGLAIGIGFYEGALAGGAAILIVMAFMRRLDSRIRRRSKYFHFYLELDGKTLFSEFIKAARAKDIELHEIEMNREKMGGENISTVMFTAALKVSVSQSEALAMLDNAPGVHYIEVLQ